MTRHDDTVSLKQMRDYAQDAVGMCRGRSATDLLSDKVLMLALTRAAHLVGEAATRVSRQTQGSHPEIPWADIVGLRNRLVHAYDQVDLELLWDIVTEDMPSLITAVERIVGKG